MTIIIDRVYRSNINNIHIDFRVVGNGLNLNSTTILTLDEYAANLNGIESYVYNKVFSGATIKDDLD
ncbi:hypothetical protein BEP19_08870 [Ammoniphilus oxalaticus]|uniref:Uncharacterized protein n=1 Tax=Ammoniphilus oxalaticus TaxID=66863 RepID=A0A419SKG6_9BACL|nr:hypothetical protein BEP19_08870 [Ammoniphilus oxalaticus]